MSSWCGSVPYKALYGLWSTTQCCMIACVVPILNQRKPIVPFNWCFLYYTSQIHLQTLINPFTLAIYLRMIDCTHLQFSINQLEQFLLECACKDSISNRCNSSLNAMQFDYIIEKYFGNLNNSKWVFQGKEVCTLCESI